MVPYQTEFQYTATHNPFISGDEKANYSSTKKQAAEMVYSRKMLHKRKQME